MRFKYTSTNAEGKQLTGVINAPSEEAARTELNKLGFSILEIKEAAETDQPQEGLQKFEFEAIDKNGKKIKGSIPAKEPLFAYKRLIEEYSFAVHYLAPENASEAEKAQLKQSGTQALQTEYELEKQKQTEKAAEHAIETPEFLEEKKRVDAEVDLIVEKIKTILSQYEGKISPDKKSEIEGYMDKLLRIKSSNNLEYIKNTGVELLQKIQEEELFLSSQEHESERKSLLLESEKMLLELQKTTASKVDMGVQIQSTVSEWEEQLKGTKFEFLIGPIRTARQWFEVNPEVQRLKTQLKTLRSQKWDALKIVAKSPKETKSAAINDLKDLQKKTKEIRSKLRSIKQLRHEKNLIIKKERHIYFIEEIETFSGWLLFFYLAYYFLGHYITLRGIPIDPFLGIPFDLSDSILFKYLLAIIFLVHAASSIKINFFLRSKVADAVLTTTTIVLCLLTLFNF